MNQEIVKSASSETIDTQKMLALDIQNMELAIAPTVADAGLETQGLEALSILSAPVPRIQRIAKHET